MKVVISGLSGFVGGELLQLFTSRGVEVVALTRSSSVLSISDVDKTLVTRLDFTIDSLDEQLKSLGELDGVIHLATNYGRNVKDFYEVFQVNQVLPMKLLNYALDQKLKFFINTDSFFSDFTDYEHLKLYSNSKNMFRKWLRLVSSKDLETKVINAKIYHVFGPGDGDEKFVSQMFQKCSAGGAIDLTDGLQERDFIFSSDVVEAFWSLVNKSDCVESGYSEYDIGRGESVSIKDFICKIQGVCKSKATLNFGALERRKDEIPNVVADVSFLKQLGWSPKTSITKGLEIIHNNRIKEN